MRLNYAIKFVSDMDAAVAFYRDKLGITLLFNRRSGANRPARPNSRSIPLLMRTLREVSNSG